MPTMPTKELVAMPNPSPERDYEITMETDEFTCLCPMTGQPDFAHIKVIYVPDEHVVELKSFKLYLWSYRNEGIFHEAVVNNILNDLVDAIAPKYVMVEGKFNIRGGIATTVVAEYSKYDAEDTDILDD